MAPLKAMSPVDPDGEVMNYSGILTFLLTFTLLVSEDLTQKKNVVELFF